MNHFKKTVLILSLCLSILLSSNYSSAQNSEPQCQNVSDDKIQEMIKILERKSSYISQLTDCESKSYKLFAKLIDINSRYFEYADERIRGDITFVKNFVKKHPDILDYISPQLKNDPIFFKSIAQLYSKALEYASDVLLNDRIFMEDMVNIKPKNFMYASERLQNDFNFVSFAVKKDGLVLRYASPQMRENKLIVAQAIKSNILASTYISPILQENNQIKNLIKNNDYSFLINIESFLRNNYSGIEVGPNGSRGYHIVNQALFLKEKPKIERNDFFKWRLWEGESENDVKLSTGRIRSLSWKTDLRDYPELSKEIKKFIYKKLDQNTADNLTITSLWVIPSNPDLVIFKMYLLRHVNNTYSNSSINNTSYIVGVAYNKTIREEASKVDELKEKEVLKKDVENLTDQKEVAKETAEKILETSSKETPKEANLELPKETEKNVVTTDKAVKKEEEPKSEADQKEEIKNKIESSIKLSEEVTKKESSENSQPIVNEKPVQKDNWILTIIDSDMDVDLDNNIILRNNHQEYEFWDIYENGRDKTSNLIFRVKDKNSEYFDIFSKQEDNKYKSIFTGGGYNFDY